MMPTAALPSRERLRRHERFQQLFRRGQKVESRSFLLLWSRGEGDRQVGFTLSRRLKGAVKRNRARRRVREAYRLNHTLLPQGIQAVFVVRSEASRVKFSDLIHEVRRSLDSVRDRESLAR